MSLLLNIARYNLRFHLFAPLLAAFAVVVLTPVLFGMTALDAATAALPLEYGLPFIGAALLIPVYAPEQDRGILSAAATRKTPYAAICSLRIGMALGLMLVLTLGFVFLMKGMESEVPFSYALASYANAAFLGGIGCMAFAASANIVIGYTVPVLYFVLDLMGGMTPLTLFSLTRGGTMEDKAALLAVGLVCAVGSVAVRLYRVKRQ